MLVNHKTCHFHQVNSSVAIIIILLCIRSSWPVIGIKNIFLSFWGFSKHLLSWIDILWEFCIRENIYMYTNKTRPC